MERPWLLLLALQVVAGLIDPISRNLVNERRPLDPISRNLVDERRLLDCFSKGVPYVHDEWIDGDIVEGVRRTFQEFQEKGMFEPSGLSNTQSNDQGFGGTDRKVCPIDIYSEYNMKGLSESAMLFLSRRVDALQKQLAAVLDRPSLVEPMPHESYLSISKEGQYLKRHLDERHEGLKNKKAWLLSSRRSISWLLYLTEPDWDKGGQLRAFPPVEFVDINSKDMASYVGPAGCSPEGDLQVGEFVCSNTVCSPLRNPFPSFSFFIFIF